ncbi:MAG: hypothetical protein LBL19_06710, partial [Spirochaetaceae bacterium]|nr:hypothetical protein [Spirochaetaceae bacterium]
MKIPVRFPGVFLILAALFFFGTSCGSLPSPAEAELPVPPEAEAEEPAAAAFTGPAAPEASDGAEPLPEAEIPTAEAVPTGPQIPETAEYGELPEPEPELADVRWPDPPREDEA